MRLKQLHITNFRNLQNTQLIPSNGVNLLIGDNASGKTSLLEAIYYLSHIRSFRTQYVTDLIYRDSQYLQLLAKIETPESHIIPIGIRRSRNHSEIRLNKQSVKRVSDIASQFPVLAIHPDSYKLITGSPSQRRQYMDWGVFHVEHGFFTAWLRFRKALLQRNAALKARQKIDICQLWNKELNETAHYIHKLRHRYFEKLAPYLDQLLQQFFVNEDVEIVYKKGWPSNTELYDLLDENLLKDRSKGYTYYGPHRAEIVIKVNGQSAQTCISRGQQKTLVALMRLAQAMQFTDASQNSCVLLYDDLPAELDSNHRTDILAVLSTMKIQLFLTAIDRQQIDLSGWYEQSMFHVEHGVITS
jgi:DNA replication and repair protein RecF